MNSPMSVRNFSAPIAAPLVAVGRTIEHVDDMEVVGEARTGPELMQLIERRRPDLVLMDLKMPGADGVERRHEPHDSLARAQRNPPANEGRSLRSQAESERRPRVDQVPQRAGPGESSEGRGGATVAVPPAVPCQRHGVRRGTLIANLIRPRRSSCCSAARLTKCELPSG